MTRQVLKQRLADPGPELAGAGMPELIKRMRLRARDRRAVEAGAAGPVKQSPQLGEGGSTGLDRSLPPSDREG